MKTKAEIDELKLSWRSDPIWDIEDTEGFEAHRKELLAYRLETERAAEARLAAEHEKQIVQLVGRALRTLPEDSADTISRKSAATTGSLANTLLRCMAEMLAPAEVAMGTVDASTQAMLEALDGRVRKLERDLAALHRDTIG